YPSYVASPTLDIYIYFIRNYQNILVKKITNINTSKGTVPVLVDNSWRLDSSAHTYNTMIYILPSELDPDKELENRFSSDYPPPVYNRVEQLALVPILTSLSITSTSQSLSSFTTTVSSTLSNSRPISISTPSPTSSDTLNSTASSSMFPEDRPPVLQTLPIESLPRPQSNASMSEPPFTSTDAILIADTFRQQDEEEKRRQLSEELLKKELEAEGTLMKKVGSKRAHLTIS
ncbi:hypothetical protein CU098_000391, partial [Rhizopus stolonifer]